MSSDAAKSAVFEQIAKEKGLTKPKALELGDRCGYGLRQAFSKEHDPAYAACVNVLKACASVAKDSGTARTPRFAFAFLVVEAPIFECHLGADGQLSIAEVESSLVLFSAYLPEHVGSCIRIVRASGLERAAADLKAAAVDLRDFLAAKQEEVIAGWSKRADA